MLVHADAIDAVLGTKKAEAIGQFDLFGGVDADESISVRVQCPYSRRGVGRQASPRPRTGDVGAVRVRASAQRGRARAGRLSPIPTFPPFCEGSIKDGTQVTVGGILASVNRRVNKNGLTWASAQLEDLTGGIEVLFFPQAYSVLGADIAEDSVVLVKARVSAAR